jgi:hypothetical protein
MEEILILIVQVLVEIFAQTFFLFPFEYFAWKCDDTDSPSGCVWVMICCAAGAGLGGLSVALAPNLLLPHVALRLLNALLSPLAVGGLAYWLARGRKKATKSTAAARYFWLGVAFSLCFTLTRLAFGNQ